MATQVRKVYLPIMGGLGNQLFQIHAAASIDDIEFIVIDSKLFSRNPQEFKGTLPENYRLDKEFISGNSYPFSWITRRICGLILRTNSYNQHNRTIKFVGNILRLLGVFLFTLRYRERIELLAPTGVGFEPLIRNSARSLVLLGYFQSNRYISDNELAKTLIASRNGEATVPITSPNNSSAEEFPLVVHVRLGDYSINPQIGMLDAKYYLENLTRVYDSTQSSIIWLFSNDVEQALKFIPVQLRSNTLVKESRELDDSETLKLMSQGHAYFIANSTFSWWAARLSTAKASNIFAPKPWFANMPDPYELIPKDWNRIESIFRVTD